MKDLTIYFVFINVLTFTLGIPAVLLDCRFRFLSLNLQLDKSGLICHSERSEESITN